LTTNCCGDFVDGHNEGMSTSSIRRELRPGDLGAILEHHGRQYTREYGVDSNFEAHVAAGLANAALRDFPQPGEAIWIVERDGAHAGSLALTDEGDGKGTVRWFVLDRELRGQGLGRRLLEELFEFARECGYRELGLETFSDLRSAAHLYRRHGFELVWEERGPRWGREEFTYQRYELRFQRLAQTRSSRSAGVSERPFSVNA
jgi:ribosomal protein S18 acetylase RimI-like enzyme